LTTDLLEMCKCSECNLNNGNPVITEIPKNVKAVLVGEAPGAEELKKGVPFVGDSGKVIRDIVAFAGFKKNEIHFTNTCLCRPPSNRTPTAKEIACCIDRLEAEINKADPDIVIALGLSSSKTIFPNIRKMEDSRGKLYNTFTNHVGVPTYHPAALLYPKGDTKFLTLLRDINRAYSTVIGERMPFEDWDTTVQVIATTEQIKELLRKAKKSRNPIVFDWETTGVDPDKDVGRCVGVCFEVGETYILPDHVIRENISLCQELFSLRTGAFNAPFDREFNKTINLPSEVEEDPMLMHYLLDERPQRRSLENLAVEFCGATPYETEVMSTYEASKDEMFEKLPLEEIYMYCGKDVDYTLRLYKIFEAELDEDEDLRRVYEYLLIPAANTLPEISRNGVWVSVDRWREVEQDYRDKVTALAEELKEITGDPEFNPNSHPQVQKFIWNQKKLDEPDIYGRKAGSVDKATRKALMTVYPDEEFIIKLDEYKTVYTMWSRYLRNLPNYLDHDNRVRCSFHIDRSETGRLSTTNPALHQIPRESDIRTVYGAPPGFKFIQADYEQVEIRMAAHIAQDEKLIKLINDLEAEGSDFHTFMASQAYRVDVPDVTSEMRQAAKVVSFGLLYLMSDSKLADGTGLPPKQALEFVQAYKELMPGVQKWIANTKKQIKNHRYVQSPFGRKRRFPFLTKRNIEGIIREGVNMPIQSGAADLTLWNTIQLHNLFKEKYPTVKVVLTVHDSIMVECPDELVDEISQIMVEQMETAPFDTEVPFTVDIKSAQEWKK